MNGIKWRIARFDFTKTIEDYICNGGGEMCDKCGEATNEPGQNICDQCTEEALEEKEA